MTKKILVAALAAACTVALTAGPAQGSGHSTLAVSLVPNFAAPVSCAGFGFGLDVASLSGRPLGTGQTCIDSTVGCDPFVPFCRQTVRSTLTLDLARGSLTMPLMLCEILPSESSFIQTGRGTVSGGTGIYAGAKGRVAGGGAGSFDEQGAFTGRLVYVADLRTPSSKIEHDALVRP
jgi:hypothetical protein